MTNIILIDDHEVVRSGVKRIIDDQPDLHVVAEAADANQAYTLYQEYEPDVLIMDVNTPDSSGISALAQVIARFPDAKILMFAMQSGSSFAIQAMTAGAKGYLLKTSSTEEMLTAIRQIAMGNSYLSAEAAQKLALHNISDKTNPTHALTPREFEIFRLLAEGAEAEKISEQLKIGLKTVANYQTQLKQKLNISTPIQLVRLAIQHDIISISPIAS
ncbi:MAG TPA: response regulator transcription factor [Methylophaga aminisulfidivorans]|uniref:Response regulator transcription factor n=2 Tax=root TaxID=1 RepID=A0A7C2ARP5_9GAMM|nr:response regulator transcription factor [Methylophaga aminisulfidivorans]